MAVTEFKSGTTPTTGLTFSGFATATTGAWMVSTGGGKSTVLAGDTASLASTAMKAAYLNCWTSASWGSYTLTIDGVAVPGNFSCLSGCTAGATNGYYSRVLMPLARGLDGGSHSLVLTNAAASKVTFDTLLVVSGAKYAVTPGVLMTCGDSVLTGTFLTTPSQQNYGVLIQNDLAQTLRRPIAHNRRGVGNDCWHCVDGTTVDDDKRIGGMYRLVQDLPTYLPEFVVLQYGLNDLRASYTAQVTLEDYRRHVTAALCFIEDTCDVWGDNGIPIKVSLGTPVFALRSAHAYQLAGATNGYSGRELEEAVGLTHAIGARFPWCRVAPVHEYMNAVGLSVYPNTTATDWGLHANAAGHAAIAAAHTDALLGAML